MKDDLVCSMLSWSEAYLLAEKAADRIRSAGYSPDVIVGITRGGWVPSMMFSDLLGVRDMFSLRVEHWGATATKDTEAVLRHPLQADLSGKRILLVDDLTDTGDSLILALEEVKRHNPKEVRSVVLVHKKQSRFKPDFYAKQTNRWEWIILPWNLNEDLLNLSRRIMKKDKAKTSEGIRKKLADRFGLIIDKETFSRVLKRRGRIWA